MTEPELPRVLCVDDEARVLEGLALHLRKDYDVHTATSGDEALKKLRAMKGAAVVVSDMRMPVMDGATLLHHVMQFWPDATRILLTGDPGPDAAVNAVNRGQIFRFLMKPCAPDQLKAAVEAGVIQHRLVNAERAVMKETLLGCIQALIDVLAITNPVAFGRAGRVKRMAMEFATQHLDCPDFWQLEAACMLSQIGYISLPVELVEKLYYGQKLTPEEEVLAGGVPSVAIKLLEHIPRLEPVMQILVALEWKDEAIERLGDGTIGTGARTLGLVLEYDSLIAQNHKPQAAIQRLRVRTSRYGAELLEKFAHYVGAGLEHDLKEMPLRYVVAGMVLMQDVRTSSGTLLIPRGFQISDTFSQRIRGFGPDLLAETVKVMVPRSEPLNWSRRAG